MNGTTTLKLQKPASDEKYNISIQNNNMDILDSEIKKLQVADQALLPKSAFNAHISDDDNPHHVTKIHLGLGNVINVRQIPAITDAVTANGVPIFSENGYQLKDSGFLIGASVPFGAKFTDTVYEHPKSEILDGTYHRVFVNGDGHVVCGENPTTLDGYGITDGESKGSAVTALADAKKYTDLQVAAVQSGSSLKKIIVTALPTTDIDLNAIYLVLRRDAGTNDKYNEYINLDGTGSGWEFLGNTAINLADYYNKSEANKLFLLKDCVVQSNLNDSSKVPSSALIFENTNDFYEKMMALEQKEKILDGKIADFNSKINDIFIMKTIVSGASYTPKQIGVLENIWSYQSPSDKIVNLSVVASSQGVNEVFAVVLYHSAIGEISTMQFKTPSEGYWTHVTNNCLTFLQAGQTIIIKVLSVNLTPIGYRIYGNL